MKLKEFSHEKLLNNDVLKENLVKFGNHVETKLLERVFLNFTGKNHRLFAFRWYKAELCNIDILSTIKVSFVAVVFHDRVKSTVTWLSTNTVLCNQ